MFHRHRKNFTFYQSMVNTTCYKITKSESELAFTILFFRKALISIIIQKRSVYIMLNALKLMTCSFYNPKKGYIMSDMRW